MSIQDFNRAVGITSKRHDEFDEVIIIFLISDTVAGENVSNIGGDIGGATSCRTLTGGNLLHNVAILP